MAETLALSGATGVELVSAPSSDADADLDLIDRTADLILLSREAIAHGLDSRFERPERIRQWTYEFDPSGLELLRRAIEHVAAREAVPPDDAAGAVTPRGPRAHPSRDARISSLPRPARTRGRATARRRALGVPRRARRRATRRPPAASPPGSNAAAPRRRRHGRQAGEIVALGLLHEVGHLLVVGRFDAGAAGRRCDARRRPSTARRRAEPARRRPARTRFGDGVPGVGRSRPAPVRLEELLLVQIANDNPAAGPLRDLVDDAAARATEPRYARRSPALERSSGDGDADGPSGEPLRRAAPRAGPPRPDLARRPAPLRPRALGAILGADLDALRPAAARDRPPRRGGAGAPPAVRRRRRAAPAAGRGARRSPAPDAEPERFSSDRDWMPRLVLIAKSTYVWLDQLSRRYGRDIRTLDEIPDEELDRARPAGASPASG